MKKYSRIILIGFMGCGKTYFAQKLSQELQLEFIDLDIEIQKTEKISIKDIFKVNGEKYFRQIESKTLREVKDNCVIAAGGGIAAGDVAVTGSHGMQNCRLIFHAATVEGSSQTVRRAVKNCLKLCQEKKIKSIAFPALGAGTGGLEVSECADAIIDEVEKFCQSSRKTTVSGKISFILWSSEDFHTFKRKLEKIV